MDFRLQQVCRLVSADLETELFEELTREAETASKPLTILKMNLANCMEWVRLIRITKS